MERQARTKGAAEQALVQSEIDALQTELGIPAIHRSQAGLISDMDYVADVLYGRVAKPEMQFAEVAAR